MESREIVSGIFDMYEELLKLRIENENLKSENNALKVEMNKPCESVDDPSMYLKVRYFNEFCQNRFYLKNNVLKFSWGDSLPNVKDEDGKILPFGEWHSKIYADGIATKVLNQFSLQEIKELFNPSFKAYYEDQVKQLKEDNSDD